MQMQRVALGKNFPLAEIASGTQENQDSQNEENQGNEVDDMVEYANGSTQEEVYQTSEFAEKIGYLNAWEKCQGKKIADGVYLVLYKIDGTNTYKSGFVKYHGGIE